MAVVQINALTMTDVRIKDALLKRTFLIAICVMKIVKIKPYTFTMFIKKYGEDKLLDCLEENEKKGIVYHRDGINGDYDDFEDVDQLMNFILTGVR